MCHYAVGDWLIEKDNCAFEEKYYLLFVVWCGVNIVNCGDNCDGSAK